MRSWLELVRGHNGQEHAVFSDGSHHIRLDVIEGGMSGCEAVSLRFCAEDWSGAEGKIMTMRRLYALYANGQFGRSLYDRERKMERWLDILRVYDALQTGAGQKEICIVLHGEKRTYEEWKDADAPLRSRIRRLVRDARHMADGGYKKLLSYIR